jgi:drug/metabolite transporter (DMT)-like permease
VSRTGTARRAAPLILAAAAWGTGAVISKQAVAEVPPLTLLPLQLAVSVLFLAIVVRWRREPLPAGRGGGRIAVLGILNPGLAYALSLLGLAQITASLSVLLWAFEPVLILVLAVIVLGERPGVALVVFSAIAVTGIGLVVYEPSAAGAWPGVLLTLAGVACCAVYTVAARRWLPDTESTLGVVTAQQAWALAFALGVLALSALVGGTMVPASVSPTGAVSVVASGLVYYGLAYWLYLTGLRHVPASVAASSFYLVPLFGLLAASITGERLSPVQWAGGAVVVIAVTAIALRSAGTPDGVPRPLP